MKEEIIHQSIENKIYVIRGQRVMFDSDLASLYGISTKVLNQAVKRNLERFPEDFMFQLHNNEYNSLRSQIVTSKIGRGGTRYLPLAFTEHGVLMLSSILNSTRAIQVNIQIMRTFARIRQILSDNTVLRLEIVTRFHSRWRACLAKQIKKKVNNHDKNIEVVFRYLDELLEKKEQPIQRNKIGF